MATLARPPLAHIVDTLDLAFAHRLPGTAERAWLVRLVDRPGPEHGLGLLPYGGPGHPLDDLERLVAPEHWSGVGLVAVGRSRRLSPAAGPHGDTPVRVVVLVHRSGEVAGAVRELHAPTDVPPHRAAQLTGPAVDACRRALALGARRRTLPT